MPQEFFNENAEEVALPSTRFREYADMPLDELVDVQFNAQRVTAQETDVRPRGRAMLQTEDLGDEALFGPEYLRPRTKRNRGYLDKSLAVSIAYNPGETEKTLVDLRLSSLPELLGPVEIQVTLAPQIVELT
jgi:hypothetical protein